MNRSAFVRWLEYGSSIGRWLGMVAVALHLPWANVAAQGSCVTNRTNNASCRLDITISSTVQATRRLVVTPGTSFSLTPASGQLGVEDYAAGMFDASGSIQLLVQSNAPWRVRMQSLSGNMSGSCTNKSASTILWGTTATARTTPVSTAATTVFSGTAPTSGQTRSIFLRVGLGWLTDAPVAETNCTLPVSFSVGAP